MNNTDEADGIEPAAVPLEPRVVAVIAAAASAALEAPVIVHQARVYHGEAERWSLAGRMDIMISHQVGPRR